MYDFASSPLLSLRSKGERSFSTFALFWALIILWMCSSAAQSFLVMPVLLIVSFGDIIELCRTYAGSDAMFGDEMIAEMNEIVASATSGTVGLLVQLFATAATIALAILFCRIFERRSTDTMGLSRRYALRRYASGLLIGFVLFALAYGICALTGAISLSGLHRGVSVPILLLFFLAYVIQGASEEILIRGFLMLSLTRRSSPVIAVVVSAATFAVLHMGNPGVHFVALLNIFLFGVFLGFFTLRSGSLVGACAIHSAWNFVEGNIYGCAVSGVALSHSLFSSAADEARALTNGGAFGPEGGLAVTLVCIFAIAAVLFLPKDFMRHNRKGNTE
jgi:membrane protease YdiL (CAAX protease family)